MAEPIGGTPLIELPRWGGPGVTILAKAEHLNPGGSVKDRAALSILRDAEAAGRLRPGIVLLDSSSGNTGIAYAMLAAARGLEVEICIPRNANAQRKRLLRASGARLIETDPLEGADGAARVARERWEAEPARYVFLDQYNNPANWRAHYETTGPEIWRESEGRLTHWVAGTGTGGTFTGVGRWLREAAPHVRRIAVQPEGPLHGLEGMKHYGSSVVPTVYDPELAHEVLAIPTEEAQATTRRLAREAGLLVGVSSGANVAAALRVAVGLEPAVVVTVLCDGGERYQDEKFWEGP